MSGLRQLACWLAGLLACWLAGLLACWLAGLLAQSAVNYTSKNKQN
jgi:hypothetical protein